MFQHYRIVLAFIFAFLGVTAKADDLRDLAAYLDNSVARVYGMNSSGSQWSGTGFFLGEAAQSGQYFFLTNHHVVEGARSLTIVMAGENEVEPTVFTGRVLQQSNSYDMALLRVTLKEGPDLKPDFLKLSAHSVQQGDSVVAYGFPAYSDSVLTQANDLARFEGTMTQGIVSKTLTSAISRLLSGETGDDFAIELIHHSAAISGGNSGGPLVNRCGVVVGQNTFKSTKEGVDDGFFSPSSKAIRSFLSQTSFSPTVVRRPCNGKFSSGGGWMPWAIGGLGVALVAGAGAAVWMLLQQRGGTGRRRKNRSKPVGRNTPFLTLSLEGQSQQVTLAALKEGISIGRDERADVHFDHPRLSRIHAKMILRDRKLQIQDANSTNGTKVDDRKLPPRAAVQIGMSSRIELGDVALTLTQVDDA